MLVLYWVLSWRCVFFCWSNSGRRLCCSIGLPPNGNINHILWKTTLLAALISRLEIQNSSQFIGLVNRILYFYFSLLFLFFFRYEFFVCFFCCCCFLIFIFTLFCFTILYWFCHTLTWICHRCTWVPNPEPPPTSLLLLFQPDSTLPHTSLPSLLQKQGEMWKI